MRLVADIVCGVICFVFNEKHSAWIMNKMWLIKLIGFGENNRPHNLFLGNFDPSFSCYASVV